MILKAKFEVFTVTFQVSFQNTENLKSKALPWAM